MAQVKVYYDKVGNTLTVWFDDPKEEYICEENRRRSNPDERQDRTGHRL